jgi:hypothetical protein
LKCAEVIPILIPTFNRMKSPREAGFSQIGGRAVVRISILPAPAKILRGPRLWSVWATGREISEQRSAEFLGIA